MQYIKIMDRENILKILSSWNFWNHHIDTGINRSFYDDKIIDLFNDNQIKIIIETGIRRSGKSFISKQIAEALIKKSFSKTQVLIINLGDERLIEREYNLLLDIYNVYRETINPDKQAIVILDEAQEVPGWERFVRGISERDEAKFIITGSSLKLLDSEYSTLLSGRHIVIYVHPLNYTEFVKFKGGGSITEYLMHGGFPAIVLSNNKQELADSYFNTIILKDVIQRFNIHEPDAIIKLAKFYITSIGSKITFNSISKFLSMPVKTIYNYSLYLEKAYLLFFVDRFSFSIKGQNNSPKKVYTIDNSFPYFLGINPVEIKGRLLENTVAATLFAISKNNPQFHFYYWNENNREVDFVVKNKNTYMAIQVSYNLNNEKTRARETDGLINCCNRLNLNSGEIITFDYAKEELINNVLIKYTPVEDWIHRTITSLKI